MGSSRSQVTLLSRDSSTWAIGAFYDRTQVPISQASRIQLLLTFRDTASHIVSTRAFIICYAMNVRRCILTLHIEHQCTQHRYRKVWNHPYGNQSPIEPW